jgi:hypothetical protein
MSPEDAMVAVKVLAVGFLLAAAPVFAQHPEHAKATAAKTGMTKAQAIASAMSAAPRSISANATIMQFPDKPDGAPTELRKGTNDWVCFPATTDKIGGGDPMCIDKQWQSWADAYMAHKPPTVTGNGVAYMLKGDLGASNTDPFAGAKTADNHWVVSPPHIMLLYADPKALDSYPDDPKSGGPWVMWRGTPYAHVMVPVSPTLAAK